MSGRWATWCVAVGAACSACAQEPMTLESVQGAWYGWLAGTGMELKIASVPEGAIAYLKTVQPEAQPFLQELKPTTDGEDLLLESLQAPQPFTMRLHWEGQLLFGTYDDAITPYTMTLARAMPDVEKLFLAAPATGIAPSPMREARAEGRRDASGNNLRKLAEAFVKYASASPEKLYPPLSATPGMLAPDADSLYPAYLTDAGLFVSPGNPNADLLRELAKDDPLVGIDDHSYWYLGYLLPDEKVGAAFLAAYASQAHAASPQFGNTLSAGGVDIPQLRVGIEQLLQTDLNNPAEAAEIAASIPVMIERPGFHEGGSNVLFLDGHVEFLAYPGPFPMTEAFIGGLLALEEQFNPMENTGEQQDPFAGSLR